MIGFAAGRRPVQADLRRRQDIRSNRAGGGTRMNRRDFIAGCIGLSLSAKAGDALGQSSPLTRIVFPFAAGGGGDALCRILAQRLSKLLDRTVIVENRTGGGGMIRN